MKNEKRFMVLSYLLGCETNWNDVNIAIAKGMQYFTPVTGTDGTRNYVIATSEPVGARTAQAIFNRSNETFKIVRF